MLTVSTPAGTMGYMARPRTPRPASGRAADRISTPRRGRPGPVERRKRPGDYHHGDLRHALLQAALHTIQDQGVEALTLRGVGQKLGVSRTALYRHFADKSALLAAVAREGFRTLRLSLLEAWEQRGR